MGNLQFINLADIFQILGGNASTGVLKITNKYTPHQGIIYFLKGNPINSECGPLRGIDAVYALFGWSDGQFTFHEQQIEIPQLIKQNRMEIVLDALRMIDDGEIKQVGPQSSNESAMCHDNNIIAINSLPVIKGPLLEYHYIVKEDLYKDGARIIKEGDHGKWMWIVSEGVAEVSRKTSRGSLPIARLGEGCYIGTFRALLYGEYQRSATMTTEGDVRLCLLDTEYLHREYSSLSPGLRQVLLSLDKRLRLITDRVVKLYENGNKNKIDIKNKDIVIKKGSSKEELYCIKEGEAFIVAETQKGNLPLITLGKDDVIGDLPFMDFGHEPRSASIIVSDDISLEPMDRWNLQEEYDNLSSTFRNLIYYVGSCVTMTTNLAYRYY